MSRPVTEIIGGARPQIGCKAAGFTLVEVLVATALTLLLMAAVVTYFGDIGGSVGDARANLEMADRLRSAATILSKDLQGITVMPLPPRRPEQAEGYLEIIEGPLGRISPQTVAVIKETGQPDTTVGDVDDVLMFTTRGRFVGRCQYSATGVIESDTAEVAWFVRGRTLYRRVLLVAPGRVPPNAQPAGFYANNDISVRVDPHLKLLMGNSLADLTRRECRFAHDPFQYPYDVRGWGQLGLPTLRECSSSKWIAGQMTPPEQPVWANQIDFWAAPTDPNPPCVHPWANVDRETGTMTAYMDGTRYTDDVILTHVIGFDVKVFDPGAANGVGEFVDLGYAAQAYNPNLTTPPGVPQPLFYHLGDPRSGLVGGPTRGCVYDTWSFHYETAGRQPGDQQAGRAVNGFDDDGNGVIDDANEQIAPPPYPAPLRGIQVRIRCFEPDSRQLREVTVVQDFLPK